MKNTYRTEDPEEGKDGRNGMAIRKEEGEEGIGVPTKVIRSPVGTGSRKVRGDEVR